MKHSLVLPNRRWLQFSLRSLLIVMTVIAGALGVAWQFVIAPAERQRVAVQTVERLGGHGSRTNSSDEEAWPTRELRRWLPRDYFDTLGYINLDGTHARDEDVACFRGLSHLHTLYLRGTGVTDAGLGHLRDLEQLAILDLSGTQITDAGLAQLRGELPHLTSLYLDETAVTNAGLVELPEFSNLEQLSLQKTAVTDAGLVHLSRLAHLRGLDLKGTQVTDAGVAEFGQSRRECMIIRNTSKLPQK